MSDQTMPTAGELAEMRAELRAARDFLRWQPIETAPRKRPGTWPHNRHWLLGWDGTQLAIIEWGEADGWSVPHDAEDYQWSDYEPTHWAPLLDPPADDPGPDK